MHFIGALINTNPTDIAGFQQKDPEFTHVYELLQGKKGATVQVEKKVKNYSLRNDILYHTPIIRSNTIVEDIPKLKQLVMPSCLRDDLLKSYHDSLAGGGHQGVDRTYQALKLKYFWPTMHGDVKRYVESCISCQRSKRSYLSTKAPLKPLPVVDIFVRWHIDILHVGPLNKAQGYQYVLVMVDSFSRWCEAFPLQTQEATEVAEHIYRESSPDTEHPTYLSLIADPTLCQSS